MITIKWAGTILCLFSILLTSLNYYPANILIGFIGSSLWAIAGYDQDDMALFTVEIVAVAFYFGGIVLFVSSQLNKWGLL
jgi:undecaprenyl pyrophosphate phosphatase UppP